MSQQSKEDLKQSNVCLRLSEHYLKSAEEWSERAGDKELTKRINKIRQETLQVTGDLELRRFAG